MFVGRKEEVKFLKKKLGSKNAEFIAIYGRRRVGKTFLIRHVVQSLKLKVFEMTGVKDGSLKTQLGVFMRAFSKTFHPLYDLAIPENWMKAFEILTTAIEQIPNQKPFVIFLDEVPWLATQKSGFLQALDHFWNAEWTKRANVKLVICGSAASWILDNIVNAKGGLHNRLTASLLLNPFDFEETAQFLSSQSIKISKLQTLQLYLIMGGIPFYLQAIDKGLSAAQNINQLCFTSNGFLYTEFNRLFSSLFKNYEAYIEIIRVLAKHPQGMDHNSLEKKLKLSKSGGTLTKRLHALEAAGFVLGFTPYGRDLKGRYYRIIDEYTLFYLKWIEPVENRIKLATSQTNYWQSKSKSPAWQSWSGYAFENFCYKHIEVISRALKIQTGFDIGTWRYIPKNPKEMGCQIDLLFDRDDGVIDLIEIKYAQKLFRITKQYATQLGDKIDIFRERLKIKKDIHLTMITLSGLLENTYSDDLVSNDISFDDLF